MRLVKSFALAVQIMSLLSGATFGWALWHILANPPLRVDGPEPNTLEYFLTLDRWTQLAFASVVVFFALSLAGFLSALALYRVRNSGRVGVAGAMVSALAMGSIDWALEGSARDLLTLAAIATVALSSIWLLFFHRPVAELFARQSAGGHETGVPTCVS